MELHIAHLLVMYLIPPTCGLALGLAAHRLRLRWYLHVLACGLAVALCLGVQYGAFVLLVVKTQGWGPQAFTLGDVISGLFWFAIPAIFTGLPLTISGYISAIAVIAVRDAFVQDDLHQTSV